MAKSRVRTLALAATALTPALVLLAGALPAQASGSFPTHYAAPYLELSSSSAGDIAADLKASGDKYYSLAFLIPKSGCTPKWEDGDAALSAFTSQVNSLKSSGGQVIVSFGGAEGGELAQTCTSVTSLTAAYANVVKDYGTRLDFDIEGSPLDNTSSISRRDSALAALQKSNPSVQVDYTLPVDSTGLESNALSLLKDAKSKGVKVNLVNIMTMDFGNGENALKDAESGATATEKQLASLYGTSASATWNKIGLTPIAGKNDDNENFTQGNAATLETFAASKGVQELAFWEIDSYDKSTKYAYSKVFNKITG
jgi:chitinase